MFATGRPTEAEITAARTATRLDAAAVTRDMKAADVQSEIDANLALARTLSLTGTPSFIIGDRILSGAVGYDQLKKAVDEARGARG
jgi:protein-disulfide isomerase